MRRRNMYYATGLPGWMRFGYSPGWVGRSASGLGPCAQYFLTGQWPAPQMQAAWQAMQAGGPPPAGGFGPAVGAAPEWRLQMLRTQAQMLEQQLEALRQQISQLEGQAQE
jgi:hypothetical protein